MSSFKRSLLALFLCLGLLVSIVTHRNDLREAEAQAMFAVSATMWKVSELVFEGQSLITAFADHATTRSGLQAVRLQFDLLWSRVDVVKQIDFHQRRRISAVVAGLDDWLRRHDNALFDDRQAGSLDFAAMRQSLDPLIVETRRAWLAEFGETRFGSLGEVASTTRRTLALQENLIAWLLGLIVLYLVGEIYFGNLAQHRERRLRDAADAASRIKSDFIANVSHEIRTPLNGIMSMASHLADQPLDAEQRQCVSVIEDSGGLLLSTINDVLDLSKIEAGQMGIEFRDFDPGRGLRLARDLYADQARAKGVGLRLELPNGPLPRLVGDERRFRQILHNLVSNAVKFTARGEVRITARFDSAPDGDGNDDMLRISVSDNGPGVPPEARDHIFEPFGQADVSTARVYGGTGLGLPIARSLCRAMGGDVTLRRASDAGACFDVELPFRRSVAHAPDAVPAHPVHEMPLLAGRVMIVDDNATNRFVLRTLLNGQALELEEADSGMAALEQLAETRVDAVLMDVQMPGMNGLETTARLTEAEVLAGRTPPPVIAVTANAMPQQAAEYRASGMVDVLPKPVSKKALLAVLRQAMAAGDARPALPGGAKGPAPPPPREDGAQRTG